MACCSRHNGISNSILSAVFCIYAEPFVIYMNPLIMTEFVIQSSISHVRMFFMDCFKLPGNLFVQPVICCFYTPQPFVVGCSCDFTNLT